MGSRLRTVAAWALLSLVACASHVDRMAEVRARLVSGTAEEALAVLDARFHNPQDLVYLLERGLLLRYARRWEESNEVFQRAEDRAEELYTKSISQTAASLLTSDVVLPYEGEDFERVLINYYKALNYLDLGDLEGALVECRRALRKLQFYEEFKDKRYRADPLVYYVVGILQQHAGDLNDAYISYKKALRAFDDASPGTGIQVPPFLARDLVEAAKRLGFSDDVEFYSRRWPHAAGDLPAQAERDVVVLVETGFVPQKTELRLRVPILESERGDDPVRLTERLCERARARARWTRVHYWLEVAIPAYPPPVPAPWQEVVVGGRSCFLVANLEASARASLEDRMPRILLRTVARAVLKYLATAGARSQVERAYGAEMGSVLGALLNAVGVITERADLRGWSGLPREVYMTRVPVSAEGTSLDIAVRGPHGPRAVSRLWLSGEGDARPVVSHRLF